MDTGYDVSDYYLIEPDYGTMEDFDNLIKKSNELGIRLMLDFIPNHSRYEFKKNSLLKLEFNTK